MRVKGGLLTLIYRKSLILNNGEKADRSTGDIVNLQNVDAVRIADFAQHGHSAWSGPFQIILAFISLYNLVGWQAFVGVAVMVLSVGSMLYSPKTLADDPSATHQYSDSTISEDSSKGPDDDQRCPNSSDERRAEQYQVD